MVFCQLQGWLSHLCDLSSVPKVVQLQLFLLWSPRLRGFFSCSISCCVIPHPVQLEFVGLLLQRKEKKRKKIEQQLAQEPCRLLWECPPCALRGDLCGDLWLAQVELQAAPGVSRQDGCGICSVCPSPPFPSQRLITNRNLLPVSRKLSWGSLSPRTIVRAKEELIMFCQNRVGEC